MCPCRIALNSVTVEALNIWPTGVRSSNIHGMRRFSRTVRQDMAAATNAVVESWSNQQAEGRINRLKMLKRAMYGRAGQDYRHPLAIPRQPGTNYRGTPAVSGAADARSRPAAPRIALRPG
jgi:hypothetical protein